jgi:hypothetical protein
MQLHFSLRVLKISVCSNIVIDFGFPLSLAHVNHIFALGYSTAKMITFNLKNEMLLRLNVDKIEHYLKKCIYL